MKWRWFLVSSVRTHNTAWAAELQEHPWRPIVLQSWILSCIHLLQAAGSVELKSCSLSWERYRKLDFPGFSLRSSGLRSAKKHQLFLFFCINATFWPRWNRTEKVPNRNHSDAAGAAGTLWGFDRSRLHTHFKKRNSCTDGSINVRADTMEFIKKQRHALWLKKRCDSFSRKDPL